MLRGLETTVFRISDNKLLHMRSVAELMYERALEWTNDEEYAQDMYLLGFLHDIGYLFGPDEHGASGAELLERNGYVGASSVRYHGKAQVPQDQWTQEVLLVQWCDMSVLPNGEKVSCSERLEDIGQRYGFDSSTYRACAEVCRRLAEHGLE